ETWDTIEYFDASIVRPAGASIRVMLSGDKHHYSRYVERGGGRQKVTCGLGGAYLTTTDELPKSVVLPPPTTRIRAAGPSTRYDLDAHYSDKRQSRRFPAGILRLPFRNPGLRGLARGQPASLVHAVLAGA